MLKEMKHKNCDIKYQLFGPLFEGDDVFLLFSVYTPDGYEISGQEAIENTDDEYIRDYIKHHFRQFTCRNELNDELYNKILVDLASDVMSSENNIMDFTGDWIKDNYSEKDFEDFFNDPVVDKYIKDGYIEIHCNEWDLLEEDEPAITGLGGLAEEFVIVEKIN